MKFKSKIIKFNQKTKNNNKNRLWWESNLMDYHWNSGLDKKNKFLYFNKIDNEFGNAHKLIDNPKYPSDPILSNFLPYKKFKNKKILEIGCGAGTVAHQISKLTKKLYCIDITKNAVNTTRLRFKIFNQKAVIKVMNGENLQFKNNFFDYVVSWGVIHHSSNMKKILDEIHRVLKENGKAFIMIYNKNSIRYRVYCFFWLGIIKLKFLKYSFKEIVGSITDGYIARHLSKDEFNLMSTNYKMRWFSISDEYSTVLFYLIGPFNRILKYIIPKYFYKKINILLAKKFGWYLKIILQK